MASFTFRPLQLEHLSSFTTPCKYPSPIGFTSHSFPLSFHTLYTHTHTLLKQFSPLPLVRSHASNIAEKMTYRELIHVGKASDSANHRDLGSGFSSLRSADERVGTNFEKSEGSSMGDQKMVEHSGREEGHSSRTTSSRNNREMDSSGLSSMRSRSEGADRKSKKNETNSVVVEKMGRSHKERKSSLVAVQKMVEHSGREQGHSSRTASSTNYREMGSSGLSSMRSRSEGADRKSKRNETNSVVVGKMGRSHKKTKSSVAINEKMMKRSKNAKVNKVEVELKIGLDMCSKTGDVMGAISLYDSTMRDGIKLEQYHYNVVLYLCSSAAIGVIHPAKSGSGGSGSSSNSDKEDLGDSKKSNLQVSSGYTMAYGPEAGLVHDRSERNSVIAARSNTKMITENSVNEKNEDDHGITIQVSDDVRNYARTRGFEIYEKMCLEKIPMSEAALTSVARMAMSMGSGDMAFDVVKQMKNLGITPRLRSYGPALSAFCNVGNVEKAFEVERHMLESGVYPEEHELQALLRASVEACRGEEVYYLLQKLRTSVRQVSPSTADLIETWFESSTASRIGKRKWDRKIVEQAMENGGGGWHGLGWLGTGKWIVARTNIDSNGVCMGCGEKLVTIDLDPTETENFARSVASIAGKRERNSSFQKFQKWLDYYGPFEAVVDAANVGLFSQRRFSITKVNAVVNGIRQKLPAKRWPLIILHNRRLIGGKMNEPINTKVIEKWKNADAIYATPTGSNDDWYWLYAAIKCKCLIVTNDEMRDHVFQILGNDFFPKWKERHQVHFSFRDGSFEFYMPPPCSVVIQESNEGHWHIPILAEHGSERERIWLCVTRASSQMATQKSSVPPREARPQKMTKSAGSDTRASNQKSLVSDESYGGLQNPIAKHPHQKIISRPQKYAATSEFPKHGTIIFDIEAAEKLSGYVIDFQI